MEKIILFAPLVGAIIAGFGWRQIGEKGRDVCHNGSVVLGLFAKLDCVPKLGTRHTAFANPALD
jgi:hypothetical protein